MHSRAASTLRKKSVRGCSRRPRFVAPDREREYVTTAGAEWTRFACGQAHSREESGGEQEQVRQGQGRKCTWRSSKSLFSKTIKQLLISTPAFGKLFAPCCDTGNSTLSARWLDAIMSQSLLPDRCTSCQVPARCCKRWAAAARLKPTPNTPQRVSAMAASSPFFSSMHKQ